jgi:hypothetical protein
MNTGLQDVHNLAWKLAWAYTNEHPIQNVLESYEQERRSIAQQNAALSLRNYQRLLEVTKSCYLNEQHPTILTKVLDHSPLPLAARQGIFRTSLQAALFPLSWLAQPNSLYTLHIRSNLERILRAGAGLPLLFPEYELGFSYGTHGQRMSKKSDTWAAKPHVEVGELFPMLKSPSCRVVLTIPTFNSYLSHDLVHTASRLVESNTQLPVHLVYVLQKKDTNGPLWSKTTSKS